MKNVLNSVFSCWKKYRYVCAREWFLFLGRCSSLDILSPDIRVTFVERQGSPGELADALPNIAVLLLSRSLLLFFPPSSQDEKHMRKGVIAQLVIFTDSAAMERWNGATRRLPRSFRNRRSKLAFFLHTAAPPAELRWSLPLRSITPLIMFKSGVTRRPCTRRYEGSTTPRRPIIHVEWNSFVTL